MPPEILARPLEPVIGLAVGETRWGAMTTGCDFAISPRDPREVCWKYAALKSEGAGKTGCALHPRSRVQTGHQKTHTSIQVQRKHSGLPCAMALRLIARSWWPAFVVTVVCEHRARSNWIDAQPQTWRQHRGVRTTRFRHPLKPRSSVVALASTASHRTFV